MTAQHPPHSLSQIVADLLPFLRRYARALTGSQSSGDRYAATTLEALLLDRSIFDRGLSHKVALFHTFHQIWSSSGTPIEHRESGLKPRAQAHLQRLSPNTREALLLRSVEEFSIAEIAQIMGTQRAEVDHLLRIAADEMRDTVSGRIMIIEDEAIIALDLQSIAAEMGHQVTGVARTHAAALALFDAERPDMILSDIQLADGSSGIEAVTEILRAAGDIPAIFITAFPERLLTGERIEPAFVIAKPYTEAQIRSAISQVMFFAAPSLGEA